MLIGHDWGAEAAYGAAAHAPDRWRRLVTLAVPPASLDPVLFSDYEQLKRFFYLFLFRDPLGFADALVASDGMSFLDRLWQDWSPGYPAGEDLARVKESLREPANLAAAIGYYRAAGARAVPAGHPGPPTARRRPRPGMRPRSRQPGARRRCPRSTCTGPPTAASGVELARGAERLLAPSSRMVVIEDAGHFLHLEKPGRGQRAHPRLDQPLAPSDVCANT